MDLRRLKGISNKSALQQRNERIHIQHLSPNRNLEVFQSLEINKVPVNGETSSKLVPYFEKKDMRRIHGILTNLHFQVKFVISWLQLKQLKIGFSKNEKRKGYLIY